MKRKKKRVKRMKRKKKAKMRKKRKPSIRELAIDILKRTGKSMHYRELTKRIKKRGYRFHRKDPERSVYIIINRYPKIFKRTRPAVYRLKK
jgi:predicted GTPase